VKTYIYHVLLAIDQLGTALIGGYPDETMSSYAYRLNVRGKRMGFMRHVIDALFFWQGPDHCRKAHDDEVARAHMPRALRVATLPP
jgi:hypothetical protein